MESLLGEVLVLETISRSSWLRENPACCLSRPQVRATSVLKKKLKSSEEASQEGANPAAAVEDEDSTDLGTDQVERRMLQRVVDALQTKVAEFEWAPLEKLWTKPVKPRKTMKNPV